MTEIAPEDSEARGVQPLGAVPLEGAVEIEWTPYELEMLDKYSKEHDDSL